MCHQNTVAHLQQKFLSSKTSPCCCSQCTISVFCKDFFHFKIWSWSAFKLPVPLERLVSSTNVITECHQNICAVFCKDLFHLKTIHQCVSPKNYTSAVFCEDLIYMKKNLLRSCLCSLWWFSDPLVHLLPSPSIPLPPIFFQFIFAGDIIVSWYYCFSNFCK